MDLEKTAGAKPPKKSNSIPLTIVDPNGARWEDNLVFGNTKDGDRVLKNQVVNAVTILRLHPSWEGVLAYDEFAECVVARKLPPFAGVDCQTPSVGDWRDEWTTALQTWLQRNYALNLPASELERALSLVAHNTRVHPVRDYLRGLQWDGVERISTWLTTILGAEDTPYTRAVARAFLVSAVARIFRPGEKVDTMLVLEGKQGKGKSTVLRKLVGDAWFVELSGKIDPKETPQQLRRKWLAEFAELASFKRTKEIEQVKSFLSRVSDNYRPPFARRAVDFPRYTVFSGSTNEHYYLQDPTGARRFWPVRTGVTREIFVRGIEIERDQLWAEAVVAFDAGEKFYLTDPDILAAAAHEQSERYEDDAWTESVRRFCDIRKLAGVTTDEVLGECLAIEKGRWSHADQIRVGTVLRRINWTSKGRERPRRYYPKDTNE